MADDFLAELFVLFKLQTGISGGKLLTGRLPPVFLLLFNVFDTKLLGFSQPFFCVSSGDVSNALCFVLETMT